MKNLFVGLAIVIFSSVSFANITRDQEYLLNKGLGEVGAKTQIGTLINKTSNLLIAKYSYAVQGGSTAAAINLLTDLNDSKSYAKLPNKAIIKNVWLNTLTQPVSSGSATVSVGAVSASDLLGSTSKNTLVVGFLQGVPSGATTSFIKLAAEKIVKATVGTAALTAGKFNVYIEYVIGD